MVNFRFFDGSYKCKIFLLYSNALFQTLSLHTDIHASMPIMGALTQLIPVASTELHQQGIS